MEHTEVTENHHRTDKLYSAAEHARAHLEVVSQSTKLITYNFNNKKEYTNYHHQNEGAVAKRIKSPIEHLHSILKCLSSS